MDELSYASYQAFVVEPSKPTIDIATIGTEDRTLTLGYDLDRATVHVYARGGEIHFHRYRRAYALDVLKGGDIITLEHFHGAQLIAEGLRPTKRAFPERTDWSFAVRMLLVGEPLTFTTFDSAQGDPSRRYHGEVA